MTYDSTNPQAEWTVFRVGQGILVQDGGVLLSGNRWYSDKPLVWTLPGGRTEEGEGVAEALVREFREETGLEIAVGQLAYVAEARSTTQRRLFLVCAFVVRRVSGVLSCERDEGVEELKFVPPAALDEYVPAPSIGDPLRHYLSHLDEPARYWFFPEYTP
jgi:ADP-ribose pyrophosphatase YjhB (NUDIX family)